MEVSAAIGACEESAIISGSAGKSGGGGAFPDNGTAACSTLRRCGCRRGVGVPVNGGKQIQWYCLQ